MAPLSSPFRAEGWPESKVTVRFWIMAIVLALLSLSTLKLSEQGAYNREPRRRMDLSQRGSPCWGLENPGWRRRGGWTGGGVVTVSELRRTEDLEPEFLRGISGLGSPGDRRSSGGHLLNSDMIVISPGVPADLPVLKKAVSKGSPPGEMELASRLIRCRWCRDRDQWKIHRYRVSGSVIRSAGFRVFVGETSVPPHGVREPGRSLDYAVVESAASNWIRQRPFAPVAVLLNITPDHLDRYPGYGPTRVQTEHFKNQGPGQFAILNDEDRTARRLPPAGRPRLRYAWSDGTPPGLVEGERLLAAVPEGSREFDLHASGSRAGTTGKPHAVVLAGLALGIGRSSFRTGSTVSRAFRIESRGWER